MHTYSNSQESYTSGACLLRSNKRSRDGLHLISIIVKMAIISYFIIQMLFDVVELKVRF